MKILQLLILVCLGIVFLVGVTSLLGVIQINTIARELSEQETPKVITLYQMAISLGESVKDIIDFSKLMDSNPSAEEQAAEKQEFQVNTNDFNINTQELRRLASTLDDKQLILLLDDVDKQFSHLESLGERLISVQENQSKKILERKGVLDEKIAPIIDNNLQKDLSPSDLQYAHKQKALLEMEINVHELFSASSGYILKPDSSLKERITNSIADFQYWLVQFLDLNGLNRNGNDNNNSTGSSPVSGTAGTARSLSTGTIEVVEDTTDATTTTIASTPQEQRLLRPTTATTAAPLVQQQIQNTEQIQYAVVLKEDFDTVSKLTQDIIELEDIEQNLLVEFATAETELEDLLDNELKSIILQKIQALEEKADSVVTMVLVTIVIAILLAIILGIVISNYIVKPLKRLRYVVNEVEAGNLDIRVDISDGNGEADGTSAGRSNKNSSSSFASEELIDLSKSFNSMIEGLKVNNRMQREFLSIASHELRSPIQPILSYADLASKGYVPHDQAIERIVVQAHRLQSLANDILDVARIEAGQLKCKRRRVSVNRVIGYAIDSIRDNLRKEVALEVQLLEHDVEIELDEERMVQALTNIIENATKFTKKGNIKIETSLDFRKRIIEIRISDTGGGIPEEIVPRLFEKFATKDVGNSAGHGTGLGLYISKAIVNAHNGTISAFNNREGGATFVISLPI
jgi:signal transduction histidine kinase/flagellar motor switch/type III secretory pathway protein FliN